MPAPIAPWMSASEALTIWMFSTAMKAPSVAPMTAIQVFADTAGAAGAAEADSSLAALTVGCSVLMGSAAIRARGGVGKALGRFALGQHRLLGVDGRHRGHAGAQQPGEAAVVEHDLHG